MLSQALRFSILLTLLSVIPGTLAGQACNADFTFLDDGLHIVFTDISTSDPGDPIVSWSWDFDDGGTSNLQNPKHTFADPDKYDVCLTIETQDGCISEICVEVEICTLTMTTNVAPNCNGDGEIEVTVTISDPFDAAIEIDVFVDGVILPGGPFNIDDNAPVVLNLALPGDGLTHTILAQSTNVGHCNISTDITTQDCDSNCFLSGLQAQITNTSTTIVEIGDNFFAPDNVTVFAGDIVDFQWLAGGHSSTSDATIGPDSWNSGIQGAGFSYQVQITNPGVHPYYCIPHGGPGGVGMSGVIVANCPPEGNFDVEISFQTTIADPAGFNLLIDGILQPGSPYSYQGTGLNAIIISIPGDGVEHTIEVQDVADPGCILSTTYASPDCGAAPACSITVASEQNGGCNDVNNVPYTLTIQSVNGGAGGFLVFVDGNQQGGATNYDPSGTTMVDIELPGDGLEHVILVQDVDDNTCSGSLSVVTPDCMAMCIISDLTATTGSSNVVPVQVADFEFVPKHLTITSGDIVEFQWVGDIEHTSTSDAVSGPDSWDSGLLGNGATFQTPVLSEGVHPYYCIPHGGPGGVGMSGTITVQADCTNGEVSVAISFTVVGEGFNGYNIYIDGNLAAGSPFPYDPSGFNNAVVQAPGDGGQHTIEVRDADDPTCLASTTITTPDCNASTCQLGAEAAIGGSCDDNDMIPIAITVTDVNGSASGFRIRIDGVLTPGSPYFYDPSGTTVIEELIAGDGQQHTVLVEDLEDGNCSAGDNILVPDCSQACQIFGLTELPGVATRHTIEVQDFEFFPKNLTIKVGDTVEWVWVGTVAHTSTSDAESGPDSWDSGLLDQGATFEIVIQTAGNHPYYCIPHGGPGGVGMSGTITATEDCENNMVAINLQFSTMGTGQSGFWVSVDGENTTNEPLPYGPGTMQTIQVQVLGDGGMHTIGITDADDSMCSATIDIETPDCSASPCQISLDATSSGCTENGENAVQLAVMHSGQGNMGFQVLVDGIPVTGSPFAYDTGGATLLDILVPGDGTEHQVFVFDVENVDCSAELTYLAMDCEAECNMQDFSFEIAGPAVRVVEVRDFSFFPDSLSVFTGDTVRFIWVGDVAHTSTSDATTGDDVWNSGLLNNGAVYDVVIQGTGMHRYYCIPHGGPGGVGMSGIITATDVCENGLFPAMICFTNSGGSVNGYNILVDGNMLTPEPIPYSGSGPQCYTANLPGDGAEHSISISDADDATCMLDTLFTFPDCNDPCFGFTADFSFILNHQTLEAAFDGQVPDGADILWEFSDGDTSLLEDPVHQFDSAGLYLVCLTVSNGEGCSYTTCQEFFIGAFVCEADFIYTNNGLEVHFRDTSETSIPIQNYIWIFGDGMVSEGVRHPVHTYADLGVYEVCLTIQAGACVTTFCRQVDLSSQCLVTNAGFTFTDNGNGSFSFQNQSSGAITSYLWGFGDGIVSNEPNPLHQYTSSGQFTVCLLILDSENSCSDYICHEIEVIVTSTSNGGREPRRILLYPNPVHAGDLVSMEGIRSNTQSSGMCEIIMISAQGKQVLSLQRQIQDRLEISLPPNLSPGVYFITVNTGSGQYLARLVVQ